MKNINLGCCRSSGFFYSGDENSLFLGGHFFLSLEEAVRLVIIV